jgi:glycosyltransferase involved in cell wall biosynthesis
MTLRIAYYLPSLEASGERTLVRSLQRRLPQDRYQTRLFGFVKNRSLLAQAGDDEYRICRSIPGDPFVLLKLAREMRGWQPDLLHTWGVADLGIEAWWPLKSVARWRVASVHNPPYRKGSMMPARGARWLHHADRVTATSRVVGSYLESRGPGTPVDVIPAAVESYPGDFEIEPSEIPSSATVIAVAGSDAGHERIREALEVMELLCAVHENLHMVLLGPAANAAWIPRFCRQLEIDSKVHIDPPGCWQQVLAGATLLLMPSESHGVSTTLFHAMAASLPLVVADTMANRSLVDESCADFFPVGDSGQCARQVHQLLKDPGRMAMMAEAARRHYESGGNLQQMVESYDLIYQELLG